MPTANEDLFDLSVGHQVQVRRFLAGEVNDIISKIEASDKAFAEKLRSTINKGRTQRRLLQVFDEVKQSRDVVWQEFRSQVRKDLIELAKVEGQAELALLQEALPFPIELNAIEGNLARTAVTSTPFQGKLLREWFSELRTQERIRLKQAITQGVVEGQTTQSIVQNIVGTRANKFTDGILSISRRNATAVVRTATNHVVNKAREDVWIANNDIISALRWTATLDGRTCFTAGHLITMADGTKQKIETVRKGDLVVGGLSLKPREVVGLKTSYKSTIILEFEDGTFIQCTPEHPFLTKKGWIDAKDLINLCVCTNISQQETIYRGKQKPRTKIERTQRGETYEVGAFQSSYQCNKQIWNTGDLNIISALNLQRGFCFGNSFYRKTRYCISQGLQPYNRRGRGDWENKRIKSGFWEKIFRTVQKRFRNEEKTQRGCKKSGSKSIKKSYKMVGNLCLRLFKEIEIFQRIQEKIIGCYEKKKSRGKSKSRRDSKKTLGRSRIQEENKSSKRSETSSTERTESRMGSEKIRKNVELNEREMDRSPISKKSYGSSIFKWLLPRKKRFAIYKNERKMDRSQIQRKNGEKRSIKYNEKQMERSPIPRNDEGSTKESKGKKVIKITKSKRAIVFDIEVETDHSFICEGLVVHNSAICRSRDGKYARVPGGSPLDPDLPRLVPQGARPPAHINCLLGDSFVAPLGKVENAMKRYYTGTVIVVSTAKGYTIECTPNHPILTTKGWAAAGQITKGDSVLRYTPLKKVSLPVNLIKDTVDMFFKINGSQKVTIKKTDFHGDGLAKGEATLGLNSYWNTGKKMHFDLINQTKIDRVVSVRSYEFSGHVYNIETSTGIYFASSGNIITHNCRSIMIPVFDDIGVVGNRPFVVDKRNPSKRLKDFRAEARTKVGDKKWKSLDPKQRNRLIAKERKAFANEAIGEVPAETTYQQFLSRQSAEFQDEVLGKTKGKLFRQGGVKLDQFVDRVGNELTIDELRNKIPTVFEKVGL